MFLYTHIFTIKGNFISSAGPQSKHQAFTVTHTSNLNGTTASIHFNTTNNTTTVTSGRLKRARAGEGATGQNKSSTSDYEDRSKYGLIKIFGHIMSEMEEGNFNFAFIWMIMLGINLFVYIYGGINITSYYCPSDCEIDTYSDCECDDVSDDSYYYYGGNYCGDTSDGYSVYCQQKTDSTWQILIAITPCTDWFLLFVYFLIYFRLHICKAFFFAIFFIPMSIVMFAFTCAITVFSSVVSPIFFWILIISNAKKVKNTNDGTIEKKSYREIDNNATHFHLIATIAHNRDWRFLVLWAIMLGGTLYMLITNAIGLAENTYKCECTVCDDYYYCDDSWDVGSDCGTDEYGADVQCEEGSASELSGYRWAIGLTYLADYLIIVFLWICVCRAGVAKACVMAIPMCIMMLGASIPFTILGGIGAMFALLVCY